jgi:quinol monooxygenase YgiN
MTETVCWILEVAIKKGELEGFRTLMNEMVEKTKASESGTLNYEWSISADQEACHIFERYRDSAAAMAHIKSFGEQFAERFLAVVEPSRMVIYGNPNEEVKAALSGFGALFMTPFGGFVR